jgi:hypothetical protein
MRECRMQECRNAGMEYKIIIPNNPVGVNYLKMVKKFN